MSKVNGDQQILRQLVLLDGCYFFFSHSLSDYKDQAENKSFTAEQAKRRPSVQSKVQTEARV